MHREKIASYRALLTPDNGIMEPPREPSFSMTNQEFKRLTDFIRILIKINKHPNRARQENLIGAKTGMPLQHNL